MGFFESDIATSKSSRRRLPLDMLERNGCSLCTLDQAKITTPKMRAEGPAAAAVYVLGEAPGSDADARGRPFVGRVDRLLKSYVPPKWDGRLRYNNILNCRPPNDRSPTEVETACCKPRLNADIEKTKPLVILGLGTFALMWATGQSRMTLWRGRRLPVKVGGHTCWFYPILHPGLILNKQNENERQGRDDETLFAFDMRRAFADLERGLPDPVVHTPADARKNIITVTGHEPSALERVGSFLAMAGQEKLAGVDYETNGRRPYASGARILSAGVAVKDNALAFAFDHPDAGWSRSDRDALDDLWRQFLVSQVRKCVHSLGFEQEWSGFFYGEDVIRAGPWEDTMTSAATLDHRVGDHKNGPLSLGFQTLENFGLDIKKLSKVDRKDLSSEPVEAVLPYNGIDAKYHLALHVVHMERLKQRRLVPQYEEMRRRIPSCVLTQLKGVSTDLAVTKELASKYADQLAALTAEIDYMPVVQAFNEKRGYAFEPANNNHVHAIMADIVGHPLDNVDENALKAVDHVLSPAVLRHRKISKRKSTYVDSWLPSPNGNGFEMVPGKGGKLEKQPRLLWPDGKLHQTINTLFAETGRSSAEDPNLQNIIKRDEEGKEVRRQVKAPPGYLHFAVDHGQIQFRNVAMESRDKAICKALWEDYDVHGEWAERLAYAYPNRVGGIDEYKGSEKVRKTFRNDVKNQFVFPLLFGAIEDSVAGYLNVPVEYVGPEVRRFWKIFSGVKDWQEGLLRLYRESGYTESLAGGRRYYQMRNGVYAPLSPNAIINAPIQNDEAAIVFDGYNRLSEMGDTNLQPIMEIHDDLTFLLPTDSRFKGYADTIVTEMLRPTFEWINVPLSIECSIGEDWLNMQEVAKFRSDKWLGLPHRDPAYM